MTILSYSGRGRGGRGRGGNRGRGYVRGSSFHRGGPFPGRGAAVASTKWVRPKEDTAVDDKQSNPSSTQTMTMTKKGPNKLILATSKNSTSLKKNSNEMPNQNNIDVQTSEAKPMGTKETQQDSSNNNVALEENQSFHAAHEDSSKTSGKIQHYDENESKVAPQSNVRTAETASSTMPLQKQSGMERRGRNQLIRAETKKDFPASQNLQGSSSNDSQDRGKDDSASSAVNRMPMKKLGRHKLVLGKKPNDNNNSNKNQQTGPSNGDTEEIDTRRKRDGNIYSNKGEMDWKRKGTHGYRLNLRGKAPFRRHPAAPRHNVAKRIKLTVEQTASNEDDDNDDDNNGDQNTKAKGNNNDEQKSGRETEKLTDFAYRETSRNRPGKLSRQRNMGLVRVQPNVKTTPICPTFLRGVDCTDKYCRKRHDVPKEFAIPICSFFQRRGQCLKGDECVFRHVKVNARALVCPSFSLLGFCDDEQCTMKHIREKTNS